MQQERASPSSTSSAPANTASCSGIFTPALWRAVGLQPRPGLSLPRTHPAFFPDLETCNGASGAACSLPSCSRQSSEQQQRERGQQGRGQFQATSDAHKRRRGSAAAATSYHTLYDDEPQRPEAGPLPHRTQHQQQGAPSLDAIMHAPRRPRTRRLTRPHGAGLLHRLGAEVPLPSLETPAASQQQQQQASPSVPQEQPLAAPSQQQQGHQFGISSSHSGKASPFVAVVVPEASCCEGCPGGEKRLSAKGSPASHSGSFESSLGVFADLCQGEGMEADAEVGDPPSSGRQSPVRFQPASSKQQQRIVATAAAAAWGAHVHVHSPGSDEPY